MTRRKIVTLAVFLGSLMILTLALLTLVRSTTPAFASPAVNIVITDPDADDQLDKVFKTRQNGDGTLRAPFEADIFGVVSGHQYVIRLSVFDVTTGELVETATPPLTARPPR